MSSKGLEQGAQFLGIKNVETLSTGQKWSPSSDESHSPDSPIMHLNHNSENSISE
jgi:hypothetical protein